MELAGASDGCRRDCEFVGSAKKRDEAVAGATIRARSLGWSAATDTSPRSRWGGGVVNDRFRPFNSCKQAPVQNLPHPLFITDFIGTHSPLSLGRGLPLLGDRFKKTAQRA